MMGEKESALEAASAYDKFYTSVRARMIVDDTYFPENYSVVRTYANVGEKEDTTRANSCRLNFLIRDAYVLKKIKSKKFNSFLSLITEYFDGKANDDLKTQQDFTTLMGLHVLQGDFDGALDIMDVAMERGFIFIGSFKEPYLRDLTSHPGFAERLEKMQKSADLLIEKYYTGLN